jgi:hypothetical protein
VRIVRGNANQDDVSAISDAFTAAFMPLPVGFLTFFVTVESDFAVVADLKVWGSVVAVSAGRWHGGGRLVVQVRHHGVGCLVVLSGGAGGPAGEDFEKPYLCSHCRGRIRLLPHQKHLRRFGILHWCGGELVNVFVSSH